MQPVVNRFYNRFDKQQYRINKHRTGCQTGFDNRLYNNRFDNRFDNRLYTQYSRLSNRLSV